MESLEAGPETQAQKVVQATYEKLQQMRALERHRISERQIEEEITNLVQAFEEVFPSEADAKPTQEALTNLMRQVEEEVSRLATPEEIREWRKESRIRLFRFLRERKTMAEKINQASKVLENFERDVFSRPINEVASQTFTIIEDC